jgi:hypothetical protein
MNEVNGLDISQAAGLSKLIACDFFGKRPCDRVDGSKLDGYAGKLVSLAEQLKIVYTAFDGDHQMFCSQMRKRVAAHGAVPANPDSVLGYKDTVSQRQTKRGVLLDDLSVLRGCDELWIFTDIPPVLHSAGLLAEGVLIELLYYKRRHPERPVRFVSITQTALNPTDASLMLFEATYDEIVESLGEDQRDEVLELSNSGTKVDEKLRSIRYYIFDPLDYKYARFVREKGYKKDACPLIPYLAARPEDYNDTSASLVNALVCWTKLMSLASNCTFLPSLDSERPPSQVVEVLRRVWMRRLGPNQLTTEDWADFNVPKASQRDKWAITARERAQYAKK